jgi:hypothetical protein
MHRLLTELGGAAAERIAKQPKIGSRDLSLS